MSDPLDDWFSSQPTKIHLRSKKLLDVLRQTYPIGVPALIAKSHTDRLGSSGGYSFHLGTPDDVLRRICSWLLTNTTSAVLTDLIPKLWKRHGREDVALVALLLANVSDIEDVWTMLEEMIGSTETAEALLLSIQECLRAGHPIPSEGRFILWCQRSTAHAHLALLTQHAIWIRSGRPKLSQKLLDSFNDISYPDGDSLLVRIRDQMCIS